MYSVLYLGVISNTEEIHYNERHNFILQVIAVDCGGKRSKTSYVNIKITQVCRSQWTGELSGVNVDFWGGVGVITYFLK